MDTLDFGAPFRTASTPWEACRAALVAWHGLSLREDEELVTNWMERLDGMFGTVHPAIRELVLFAALLKGSDPEHRAVALVPQLLPLPAQNAASLFHSTTSPELLLGFVHEDDAEPEGPPIWTFDFDRIPDDLNPEHLDGDLTDPDMGVRAPDPGTFALCQVLSDYTPDGALEVGLDHDDPEAVREAMDAAYGPGQQLAGTTVWGAPGILLYQRYWGMWLLELTATSLEALDPFTDTLCQTLFQLPRRAIVRQFHAC